MTETYPILDLILVHQPNGHTMTGLVQTDAETDPVMLGPVPARGGIGPLAVALMAVVPGRFATQEAAEDALILVHMRNMHYGRNSAGQDYPFRVGGEAS
jgi:hypothetical protein